MVRCHHHTKRQRYLQYPCSRLFLSFRAPDNKGYRKERICCLLFVAHRFSPSGRQASAGSGLLSFNQGSSFAWVSLPFSFFKPLLFLGAAGGVQVGPEFSVIMAGAFIGIGNLTRRV